jgi:hypothetical protein
MVKVNYNVVAMAENKLKIKILRKTGILKYIYIRKI